MAFSIFKHHYLLLIETEVSPWLSSQLKEKKDEISITCLPLSKIVKFTNQNYYGMQTLIGLLNYITVILINCVLF